MTINHFMKNIVTQVLVFYFWALLCGKLGFIFGTILGVGVGALLIMIPWRGFVIYGLALLCIFIGKAESFFFIVGGTIVFTGAHILWHAWVARPKAIPVKIIED